MTITLDAAILNENQRPADSTARTLTIAACHDSPFAGSIVAAGHRFVALPKLADPDFNRTIQARITDGAVYQEFFRNQKIDLLVDIETTALTFVPDAAAGPNACAMTHATCDVPYVSHFVDPITETMKNVDWGTRWSILEHDGWIKWVWDDAHATELRRLGVPNVLSMPMATADETHCLDPLPENPPGAPVAFVGHPATSWFNSPSVSPQSMRIGLIAAAAKADNPDVTFHELYYDYYEFAEPPNASESPADRAQKAAIYFANKFTYNVFLAVKQRDRFVLFLRKKLGEQFELVGDYWPECVGVQHKPRISGRAELFQAYRDVGICVNLYKGNAETGLNLRQFEVTAAGGFLLTYKFAELSKYYEVGKECVVFDSERDLLDKIRYYSAHPAERIEIALAGQRRALSQHLYSHRIRELLKAIRVADTTAGNGVSPHRTLG
jgi:Glycosyl transferases group 1